MTAHWAVYLLHASQRVRYRLWLVFCGILVVAGQALAGERVLDAARMGEAPVSLTDYLAVLEDPSLALGVEDVGKPDIAARLG
jgi:hypothetical protein